MIVTGGSSVSFNYPTFDQASGLYVAATVYDVTTGIPSVVGSKIAMTDKANGVYAGSFTPASGKSYLVIMGVYLDSGFTTIDSSRSPGAEQYDAFVTDNSLLNFNYGAYDQDSSLDVSATVFNITDSSTILVSMDHVYIGVYFGQYQGAVSKQYVVVKAATDLSRPPGADSFQTYTFATPPVPIAYSASYYGIEHLLRDIKLCLKTYLNGSISSIEALNVADGLPATGLLPVDVTNGYFEQSWNPRNMNINPAIFYGVEDIATVGTGPSTAQTYKIFIELILVDGGTDALGISRIHRYSQAIRRVLELNYDVISRGSKIKIETIRPISFKLEADSSEEIRVGGVSIITSLA